MATGFINLQSFKGEKMDSPPDTLLLKLAELAEEGLETELTLYINGVILSGSSTSTQEYVQRLERAFAVTASYEELPANHNVSKIFNMLFDQIKNNFSGVIGEKKKYP